MSQVRNLCDCICAPLPAFSDLIFPLSSLTWHLQGLIRIWDILLTEHALYELEESKQI